MAMLQLNRQNRGFTLLEVVVALGILSVALATTVTLVVNAMNLEIYSRQKTEATALAQKYLSNAIAHVSENCNRANPIDLFTIGPTDCLIRGTSTPAPHELCAKLHGSSADFNVITSSHTNVSGSSTFITITDSDANPSGSINPDEYIKIESRVNWTNRFLGASNVTLTQYLKVRTQ